MGEAALALNSDVLPNGEDSRPSVYGKDRLAVVVDHIDIPAGESSIVRIQIKLFEGQKKIDIRYWGRGKNGWYPKKHGFYSPFEVFKRDILPHLNVIFKDTSPT